MYARTIRFFRLVIQSNLQSAKDVTKSGQRWLFYRDEMLHKLPYWESCNWQFKKGWLETCLYSKQFSVPLHKCEAIWFNQIIMGLSIFSLQILFMMYLTLLIVTICPLYTPMLVHQCRLYCNVAITA